mmetsp:Transcript_33205/g.77366  ORF Transcript_33205/g.77366 Transcript_33205/m.77366 type:complete len:340 (-) Transcript_33205:301-1320(-)
MLEARKGDGAPHLGVDAGRPRHHPGPPVQVVGAASGGVVLLGDPPARRGGGGRQGEVDGEPREPDGPVRDLRQHAHVVAHRVGEPLRGGHRHVYAAGPEPGGHEVVEHVCRVARRHGHGVDAGEAVADGHVDPQPRLREAPPHAPLVDLKGTVVVAGARPRGLEYRQLVHVPLEVDWEGLCCEKELARRVHLHVMPHPKWRPRRLVAVPQEVDRPRPPRELLHVRPPLALPDGLDPHLLRLLPKTRTQVEPLPLRRPPHARAHRQLLGNRPAAVVVDPDVQAALGRLPDRLGAPDAVASPLGIRHPTPPVQHIVAHDGHPHAGRLWNIVVKQARVPDSD